MALLFPHISGIVVPTHQWYCGSHILVLLWFRYNYGIVAPTHQWHCGSHTSVVLWFRYNCGIVVPIHQQHCGAIHQWHCGSHTSVYCHSHTTVVLHTPILACCERQWDSLSMGKVLYEVCTKTSTHTRFTMQYFLHFIIVPRGLAVFTPMHNSLIITHTKIQKVMSDRKWVRGYWHGLNSDPNPLIPASPVHLHT